MARQGGTRPEGFPDDNSRRLRAYQRWMAKHTKQLVWDGLQDDDEHARAFEVFLELGEEMQQIPSEAIHSVASDDFRLQQRKLWLEFKSCVAGWSEDHPDMPDPAGHEQLDLDETTADDAISADLIHMGQTAIAICAFAMSRQCERVRNQGKLRMARIGAPAIPVLLAMTRRKYALREQHQAVCSGLLWKFDPAAWYDIIFVGMAALDPCDRASEATDVLEEITHLGYGNDVKKWQRWGRKLSGTISQTKESNP